MKFFCFLLGLIGVLALTFAANAGEPDATIATDIWSIALPIVQSLSVIFGPLFVAWLTVQLSVLLGIQSDAKRQEIEIGLRNALHAAALNGVKVAVSRLGLPTLMGVGVDPAIVNQAVDYVVSKNPETIKKLGIDTADIAEIVMSKVPDVVGTHVRK